jgi:hypothetical protein
LGGRPSVETLGYSALRLRREAGGASADQLSMAIRGEAPELGGPGLKPLFSVGGDSTA